MTPNTPDSTRSPACTRASIRSWPPRKTWWRCWPNSCRAWSRWRQPVNARRIEPGNGRSSVRKGRRLRRRSGEDVEPLRRGVRLSSTPSGTPRATPQRPPRRNRRPVVATPKPDRLCRLAPSTPASFAFLSANPLRITARERRCGRKKRKGTKKWKAMPGGPLEELVLR